MANGELPEGWERVPLGDRRVASIVMGQSPSSASYNTQGVGLPFFQGKADFGMKHPTPTKWCSAPSKVAEPGDVLISVRAPVGDVNIATQKCCIGRGIGAIRHGSDADGKFLFYALMREKERLAGLGTGAIFGSINKNVLYDFELDIPSLPEQRAIVGVLSKLQGAVEAQDKIIATLKELKAATLAKLFREGLRGEPLKETEIGEIPESWEVSPIGNLLDIQLGKMLSPKARGGADPKPYLRNANVQWGRFDLVGVFRMDFSEREKQKFLLRKGDVLICEGGEPGRTAVWDMQIGECYYQKALHRLRPKGTNLIKPAFFSYWMDAAFRLFGVYGLSGTKTTIAHLPAIKLAALPIPRPSIEEQQEISCAISAVDRRLINAEQEHLKTTALFQSMLHLLMTGEVRLQGQPTEATRGLR